MEGSIMKTTYYHPELTGEQEKFSAGMAEAVSHLVMAGYRKGWETITLDYIKDILYFNTPTEVHSILLSINHMKLKGVLKYKKEGKFQRKGVYVYNR